MPELTARQHEIAQLVVRGCTNAEIARMLALSPSTIKVAISRLLMLFEVSNRTELAAELTKIAAL
jgi:DNA-binding NarL/FixJ family response regulator